MIYNPLEEYENKFKNLHYEKVNAFYEELVKQSGINVAQNQKTVKLYNDNKEFIKKNKRKLGWLKFLRVLMCITLVLIPLVIMKTTPKIKELRSLIENADQKAEELLEEAKKQMQPLNNLFTDRDALKLIEETIPTLNFDTHFSIEQEADMRINYDFGAKSSEEESTLDVLAGQYNENPFLFENRFIHKMGTETYHGYRTIHWTETYRDSDGKIRTRMRSETLHATVTKPKPFYKTKMVLNYCAQGGPDLKFSRDASNLHTKSDKQIERLVKSGGKRLDRKAEQALSNGGNFTSMSNTEFEVLFDALDRNNEVQFRTLFTPLAQTNMVDLIRSETGYGDDFSFIKNKRTNKIISNHSQSRDMNLSADKYVSYSFDIVKENFISKNQEFFRAVYFDFAPLWAIPMYQERPANSLKPIPDSAQLYPLKECEALANAISTKYVAHPKTRTDVILKSTFVGSKDNIDETCVTAYSYDIKKHVTVIPVYGGDGKYHDVSVEWKEYLPLTQQNNFYVSTDQIAQNKNVMARRNGLCIFN